ncbi:replication fork protection component Swi3-domain-containing protein [Cladochytrium replicatum]|nr:replication fork protection component Swi3-domain-containing protein [Cladochytrium replicatum]
MMNFEDDVPALPASLSIDVDTLLAPRKPIAPPRIPAAQGWEKPGIGSARYQNEVTAPPAPDGGDAVPRDYDDAAMELDMLDKQLEPRKAKLPKKARHKIDNELLLGPRGFSKIRQNRRKLKFKGKGHEMEDVEKLLMYYQIWAHELMPSLTFESVVERVETLCHTRQCKMYADAVVHEQKLIDLGIESIDGICGARFSVDLVNSQHGVTVDKPVSAVQPNVVEEAATVIDPPNEETTGSKSGEEDPFLARVEANRLAALERLKQRAAKGVSSDSNAKRDASTSVSTTVLFLDDEEEESPGIDVFAKRVEERRGHVRIDSSTKGGLTLDRLFDDDSD